MVKSVNFLKIFIDSKNLNYYTAAFTTLCNTFPDVVDFIKLDTGEYILKFKDYTVYASLYVDELGEQDCLYFYDTTDNFFLFIFNNNNVTEMYKLKDTM